MAVAFGGPNFDLADVVRDGFSTKRTGEGKGVILPPAGYTNMVATTCMVPKGSMKGPGQRYKADGAVVGRWEGREQVGTLELLLEFLAQRIEPLVGIFWR